MYEAQLPIVYGIYVALALAAYEHVITLESEYEFVWRRKWTVATWLFIANRYTLLACVIFQSAPYSAQSFLSFLYNMPLIISALFSALRVFALLGYGYLPAGCVFLLGMTQVVINLYESAHAAYNYVDGPLFGSSCFPSSRLPVSTRLQQAARVDVRTGFGLALIEYGTLFFVALCVMNILALGKIFTPFSGLLVGDTTVFIFMLPNILLSRFLINLRHIEYPASSTVPRFSQFSVPNFRVPSLPEDQEDREYRCEAAFCEECSNRLREYRDPRDSDRDISGVLHAVGDDSNTLEVSRDIA
ncbi:hypothetical protein NM688_g3812 [Phlebia brevispora]|uniref:Uncharacterized protein n=1 Tax=Phlebia brevispora TaxID=194682 RepID=A0ACC1T4E9_9APHY|nr:hypothetical protein NM688_g3812 [Phlebia brevispora]